MSITVAAWNIQEGLASPERSASLVEGVKSLDADIVYLSDAFWPGNPLHRLDETLVDRAEDNFRSEGYELLEVPYEDASDPYTDRYMLGLGRIGVAMSSVNLAGRNAVKVQVHESQGNTADPLQVVGVHLDDRYEVKRFAQAQALIDETIDGQNMFIGDFNAHARASWQGALIGSAFGKIRTADHISRRFPDRARAVASKLGDMVSGVALDLLAEEGFIDADPKHRATYHAMLPILQLDKCLVSGGIEANFEPQSRRRGSDHLPIKVSLNY